MKQIPLTKGLVALVDDEVFPMLSQYSWFAQGVPGRYYAATKRNGCTLYMHHLLCPTDDPLIHRDHINGDCLDNRRANLRLATRGQNAMNTQHRINSSGFKGVSLDAKRNRWRAQIKKDGKSVHLGYFTDMVEAAKAYDQAALKLFGEFACINGAA